MLTNSFLVSIIIPTYNRKVFLQETLHSLVAQTYTPIECLIVDDGSTDGTCEMLHAFCAVHTAFRYIQRPSNRTKGASTCRNIGLQHARGTYILFFDSDDILPPDALQKRMEIIQTHTDFDFWVFQTVRFQTHLEHADRIWNDLSKPNEQDLPDFLGINPVWHTSGPLWKKTFLHKHALTFTEGVHSWQDWEFHIRVLLQNPSYLKIQDTKAATFQRFHDATAINKTETQAVSENRISLFFILISAFKTAKRFDATHQQLFLKLFYFVLSKQTAPLDIRDIWKQVEAHLSLLPKADLRFWKYYLLFLRANTVKKSNVFLFLVKLKPYFEKRIPVTDFTHRTWYRIPFP